MGLKTPDPDRPIFRMFALLDELHPANTIAIIATHSTRAHSFFAFMFFLLNSSLGICKFYANPLQLFYFPYA